MGAPENADVDGTVMTTASGGTFDLARPSAEGWTWEDIAWGLANTCRFGGQVRAFYSVAEHSCHVAHGMPWPRPDLELAALLHDAHEAFYGDVIRPLKRLAPDLVRLMAEFDLIIAARAGIDPALLRHPQVVRGDELMLRLEAASLYDPAPPWASRTSLEDIGRSLPCWPPHSAKERWLGRVEALMEEAPRG